MVDEVQRLAAVGDRFGRYRAVCGAPRHTSGCEATGVRVGHRDGNGVSAMVAGVVEFAEWVWGGRRESPEILGGLFRLAAFVCLATEQSDSVRWLCTDGNDGVGCRRAGENDLSSLAFEFAFASRAAGRRHGRLCGPVHCDTVVYALCKIAVALVGHDVVGIRPVFLRGRLHGVRRVDDVE